MDARARANSLLYRIAPIAPMIGAMGKVEIRLASIKDLMYVVGLQNKFSNQLGFLPRQALEEHLKAGFVTMALENSEPAGYILVRNRVNSARWCRPITQIAVQMDAQRRHIGLRLLNDLEKVSRSDLMEGLQCWVRDGLEAVEFFESAGFELIGSRDPQSARQRRLLCFRRSLQPFHNGDFFTLPRVAGATPRRIIHQDLRTAITTATLRPRA